MDRPEPQPSSSLTGNPPGGQLVLVQVGGCRYGLPMDAVAEVGRPPTLTRVPGLPPWAAGVANWRGRVLAALGRRGRLVVLSHTGVRVGLLVESVAGGVAAYPEHVEPALSHLPERAGRLLLGQVTDGAGPYGLIDLDAVLALADGLPRVRRAG